MVVVGGGNFFFFFFLAIMVVTIDKLGFVAEFWKRRDRNIIFYII